MTCFDEMEYRGRLNLFPGSVPTNDITIIIMNSINLLDKVGWM